MPKLIDRYEIIKKISEGNISIAYEAHDPGTGRDVVIKLMKQIDGPEAEEEFIRESRIIGRLNHHNIVSIFDVGDHDGRPFIAMELLKGEFLSALMSNGKRFSWGVVSHVAMQIASALEYAHNQGVVHGDIRPGNVLWNKEDNKVVLTDFGNATRINIYDTATLNVDQVSKSAPYLSPEILNGNAIDNRSDLFSLGSLLYQMLTGYKPFDSDDFKELTTQITKRAHKAISVSVTQVPEQFIRIIDRLLYKNPEDRYQSATDFIAELKLLPAAVDLPNPYSGKNNFKIAAAILVVVSAGIVYWTLKDSLSPDDKVLTGAEPPSAIVEPAVIARVVPPVHETKEVQLSTLQASINKKLAKFECASLRAHMSEKSEVHIKGHVSLEEDMMSLMDLMDGYPGLSNVIYEVDAIKWPFCEAIAILSGETHSNISNSSGLKLVSGDIDRQVTNTKEFNFNVVAPGYDSYIYVDYYHINGTVTHLYPGTVNRSVKTAATSEFKVSHKSTSESGSLLGESLVVVLASYNPLNISKRPKVEPAQQYLSELHREVVVNKLELSSSFMLLENIESSDN